MVECKTKKEKKATGTAEWAAKTVNIQYGCENDCKYCYAKRMARRFSRIPAEGWDKPILKTVRPIVPRKTNIMFPSTHDITPNNLKLSIQAINIMLSYGNQVLIVSKPRLECIQAICENLQIHNTKDRVEFRFTIGSMNDLILLDWEPHAPKFQERFECALYTLEHQFKTSVSCEPLLDNIDASVDRIPLIDQLLHLKIETIWIGAMQYIKDSPYLNYRRIYDLYSQYPEIRFKDSFFKQALKHGIKLRC